MNEEIKETTLEIAKCKQSFVHFLSHVKIVEPPTLNNPGGVIRMELWPHLVELIRALLSKDLIVVLKARQVGVSWLLAAYALWYALSHYGANVMLFSKGEAEAIELLAKCKRIFAQLPDYLKLKLSADSTVEMSFPVMASSIKAFAATETAGISYTASLVVCDEWDEHPYADEQYLATKPTRDAGGQFVGAFTVNKMRGDTLAKSIFKDAMAGNNDFVPMFFAWDVRPTREKTWYAHTKRNVPERDLAKLTPELYMEQNYPSSWEEALRPTQTICAFDIAVLQDMEVEVKKPLNVGGNLDPKVVHIYQPYHIGEKYVAASDTGHGIGKDFSVTVVMNVRTGNVVADIVHNRLRPEEFALHSVRLLQYYNNPLWFPEDNEWGRVLITVAQSLDYRSWGYQDARKSRAGFHTDERTRFDLWGALIPAINNRQITIFGIQGLKQFYDVIRNAEKDGRIEALKGRHDDYPIAVGICWLKRHEVSLATLDYTPVQTLHFGERGPMEIPWRKGRSTRLIET